MSLKELTAEKHKLAENSKFMQAVFAKTITRDLWMDWTYQKALFYHALEGIAGANKLLSDLPDIRRGYRLWQDYYQMLENQPSTHTHRSSALQYHSYLLGLTDPKSIMAHLYTWHMGDLYGGQMIKQLVDAPHSSLEFDDPKLLVANIRNKLTDDMAPEACVAFDWALKMMQEYDHYLD